VKEAHWCTAARIDGKDRKPLQSLGLLDAKPASQMLRIKSRPIRTVLAWQLMVTVALAVLFGWAEGLHGAISAAFGGGIGIAGGVGFAAVVGMSKDKSAGGTLVTALQAESVKIGLSVILLWAVLTTYTDVMAAVCIGSFILSILIFSMAFFVRDNGNR
jgi:ATP synthase protein I